jgi:hypothetical protein
MCLRCSRTSALCQRPIGNVLHATRAHLSFTNATAGGVNSSPDYEDILGLATLSLSTSTAAFEAAMEKLDSMLLAAYAHTARLEEAMHRAEAVESSLYSLVRRAAVLERWDTSPTPEGFPPLSLFSTFKLPVLQSAVSILTESEWLPLHTFLTVCKQQFPQHVAYTNEFTAYELEFRNHLSD